MVLRTFGGLRLDGCAFTRPKPLLLVTYLAVEGAQPRRRLAALFWPGGSDPMKSLTVALARIRKGAPGVVDADGTRAWATVDSDVQDFLEACETGTPAEALARYEAPFLEGYRLRHGGPELEEWIFETREFLAAHARRALLERAEDAARSGRFGDAAAHAERAMEVAEGVPEPAELARMHTMLVAGGSALAGEARRRSEPFGVSLCTTAAEARERLTGRPRAGADGVPTNLPARATSFVGRGRELEEVSSLLERPEVRLVTVKGPAGVGKSRVVLESAREQLGTGRFPDGVYYVSLEPLTSADHVPTAVADALDSGASGASGASEGGVDVVERIGHRELLLVLDGFEQFLGAARTVSRMILACPGLSVMVASRARVNLEEEHVVELHGLPFPDAGGDRVEDVLEFDAVRLFTQRARQANPAFEPTPDVLPGVVDTCRLVEGLPLGIELAATWLRVLPPAEIAAEVARNPGFLVTRSRNVPDRHRSLRGAFEHSWELLSGEERAVMRKASAFRGGFRRHAAAAVADATIPRLASLIEQSMLRADGTGRYERHPLLYQFVREKAASHPEELTGARERHGRWFLDLLAEREDDLVGIGQTEALAAIEEELENVRVAWRWAADGARVEELGRACRPLQLFYIQRGGMAAEAAVEFSRAGDRLDAGVPEHVSVLGRIRAAEAWFRFLYSDFERSESAAREGIRLLQPFADGLPEPGGADEPTILRAVASARNTLGTIAKRRGDFDGARRHYRAAMGVAERMGNDRQIALFTNNLALLFKDLGKYPESERLYREAIDLNRRLGNHRSVVRNLANLGAVLIYAGRPTQAEDVLDEGLELAREVGYDAMVPTFLMNAGGASFVAGDYERARGRLREALDGLGERSGTRFRADAIQMLGRTAAALGDSDTAVRYFREALRTATPDADRATVMETLCGLAELFESQGDLRRAARVLALGGEPVDMPRPVADGVRAVWRRLEASGRIGDLDRIRASPGGVEWDGAVAEALRLSE